MNTWILIIFLSVPAGHQSISVAAIDGFHTESDCRYAAFQAKGASRYGNLFYTCVKKHYEDVLCSDDEEGSLCKWKDQTCTVGGKSGRRDAKFKCVASKFDTDSSLTDIPSRR